MLIHRLFLDCDPHKLVSEILSVDCFGEKRSSFHAARVQTQKNGFYCYVPMNFLKFHIAGDS